jgi:hypothetical protein
MTRDLNKYVHIHTYVCGTGILNCLLGRHFDTQTKPLVLFLLPLFFQMGVLHPCLGLALDWDSPTYSS